MRKVFTLFATFALLISLSSSCDESGDNVETPGTEEGTGGETGGESGDGSDDESDDMTEGGSDITAKVTTTEYVYKTSEAGNDIKIFHVATDTALVGEPKAAIIFFHGGGWSSGSWATFQRHCDYLATQGIVCFSSQYRVTKNNTIANLPEAVSIIDCLRDARSAVRWVKANAEKFNIDPNKIVTSGGSAGGCLAAGISMSDKGIVHSDDPNNDQSLDIAANVLFNPVVNNVANTGFPAYNASGVEASCTAGGFEKTAFSPFSNVGEDTPPTIFLVGEVDEFIPPTTAIEYQRRIEEKGSSCELWIHENRAHSFYNFNGADATGFVATMPYVHDFLRKLGFINDNDSQVTEWLAYYEFKTYSYVDNFLYDTSKATIADDYTKWCTDNSNITMKTLGTNLLTNGDFENGTLEGWTPQEDLYQNIVSDLSYVVEGNHSLLTTGSWQKIWQEVPVVAGERYYFGFTARHTKGSHAVSGEGEANTGSCQLSLRTNPLNGSAQLAVTPSISVNSDTAVWGSAVFGSNVTSVYVTLATSGGFATSDNFYIALAKDREEEITGNKVEGFDPLPEVDVPAGPKPGENMLVNGDFESAESGATGAYGWLVSAGVWVVSPDFAIAGERTLYTKSNWSKLYQVVSLVKGKKYTYGYTGRKSTTHCASGTGSQLGNDNQAMIMGLATISGAKLVEKSESLKLQDGLTDISTTKNQSLVKTFTYEGETAEVAVWLAGYTNNTGYLYYDDVFFKEVVE